MKKNVISLMFVLGFVVVVGALHFGCCDYKCETYSSICPGGLTAPDPKNENCTWDENVYCGGCAVYSVLYGITECFHKTTGAPGAYRDCERECPECSVAKYKAGAICIAFRYDKPGCLKEDCGFYQSQ